MQADDPNGYYSDDTSRSEAPEPADDFETRAPETGTLETGTLETNTEETAPETAEGDVGAPGTPETEEAEEPRPDTEAAAPRPDTEAAPGPTTQSTLVRTGVRIDLAGPNPYLLDMPRKHYDA